MIFVGGRILPIDNLIKDYKLGSVEREIIHTLDQSTEKYNYDSIALLKFELTVRSKIIESSMDLYKSNMDFEVFRKTRCNPTFWKRTREGGFKLLTNAKPSDAIRDIYKNSHLYATECATAMVIIYYKALLETFPEQLFNQTFQQIHLMNWHYLDKNLQEIGIMSERSDYLLADRRYFKNPDVNYETPQWQGENVIALSNSLYYGHGMGILSEDTIIKTLNQNRFDGAKTSSYLVNSSSTLNFKRLHSLLNNFTA